MTAIGIVNYGMGNLRSVQKAFESLGFEAAILSDPAQCDRVDRLILPGVGAFGDGMKHLDEQGWSEAVRRFVATGKPMLGICLGMQLLFDSSEEDAVDVAHPIAGLGLIPGRVVRFQEDQGPGQPRLKVPHMGWNALAWEGDEPLLAGLEPGVFAYFVHGYYCMPADASHIAATATYGASFCAVARRDNLHATQFHPEKSQQVGLRMLANFARC